MSSGFHLNSQLMHLSINDSKSADEFDLSSSPRVANKHMKSKFGWLDTLMLYMICVRSTPSQKARSKCCNISYITFNIFLFCLLSLYIGDSLFSFINQLATYRGIAYIVSVLCYLSLFVLIRLFSFWYYRTYFNYPWHANVDIDVNNNNNDKHVHHTGYIGRHFLLIMCFLIFIKVANITVSVCYVLLWSGEPVLQQVYDILVVIAAKELFYYIPAFFILIVQATICYKYHWYLMRLMNKLENMDCTQLHVQYQKLYDLWLIDYNFYLKWTGEILIVSIFLSAWTDIFHFNVSSADLFDVVRSLNMVLLYFVPASLMSDTFDEFQNLLWKKLNECIGDEKKLKTEFRLSSFIAYTAKFPLHVEFGGITVSKKNIVLFVLLFIAARFDAPTPNNFIQSPRP